MPHRTRRLRDAGQLAVATTAVTFPSDRRGTSVRLGAPTRSPEVIASPERWRVDGSAMEADVPRSTPDPAQLEIQPAFNVVGRAWVPEPDEEAQRELFEQLRADIMRRACAEVAALPCAPPEEAERWAARSRRPWRPLPPQSDPGLRLASKPSARQSAG